VFFSCDKLHYSGPLPAFFYSAEIASAARCRRLFPLLADDNWFFSKWRN